MHNFLKANILGIFISGFSCNLAVTKEILEKNNQMEHTIQLILQPNIYTTLYDRKVIFDKRFLFLLKFFKNLNNNCIDICDWIKSFFKQGKSSFC